MISKLIAAIERDIEGHKEDLSNGLSSHDDFRYVVGIIRGLRDAIETIKESERVFLADEIDDGSDDWSSASGGSGPNAA